VSARLVGLLAIFPTILLGCTHASPPGPGAGEEGGACFPHGTCNAGLTCRSALCVSAGPDDAGAGGSLGSGGLGAYPDGGAAGTGGEGTAGATAAAGSGSGGIFVPAAHPDLPRVQMLGGPVLVAPKVRPIVYMNDLNAVDIESFVQELAHTSYWGTTTAEYGVGALTVLPTITIPGDAPVTTTDADLQTTLVANTSGSNPPWGPADPSVVYLFVIPDGTSVEAGSSTCCTYAGGYHSEVISGSVSLPYAVGCSCPFFHDPNLRQIDERTTVLSHELVEAATDPFPGSRPAYTGEDPSDLVWSAVNGGEVADMCEWNFDSHFVPSGSTYMVQRTWSNAAAQKAQNPCVPYETTAPYFNSFPALDTVSFGPHNVTTRGVRVPFGESRTVDVNLFSAAATNGTWTVTAVDYDAWVLGLPANLTLSLDRTAGVNGDTLHLTITPQTLDLDLGGEAFILISFQGAVGQPNFESNLTIGLVTN
jgi:hypothetical protein